MNKLIIANWKMNPQTEKEALSLFNIAQKKVSVSKKNKLIICPPFPFLFLFKKNKISKIFLGAQNVYKEAEGSFTGEVSPKMLIDLAVKYVIIGHGERRRMGEDEELINQKTLISLKNKISPIVCIGEQDRDTEGCYLPFLESQIKSVLNNVSKSQVKNVVIAYEPLWAIGKNATREATPEGFVEVKIFIKKIISDIYGAKVAHEVPVVYGGSINAINAKSFLEAGADGLLVGRDSINPNKFEALLEAIK